MNTDANADGEDTNGHDKSLAASTHDENTVAVWDLLPHLLSEELQLYFTRIAYALQKGDAKAQDAALLRLRYDSGIQELVPFFLSFLTPTTNAQMANVQQSLLRIQCIQTSLKIIRTSQEFVAHLRKICQEVAPIIFCSWIRNGLPRRAAADGATGSPSAR